MEAAWIHRLLCVSGDALVNAFYSSAHADGGEHIPRHGVPLVVVSSHHNQIVDICVQSRDFPHKRRHSYWAKRSLFKNPVARYILLNSGNIPVDRRKNDNQALLRDSLNILKSGEALVLFPEGTSYTEPRIVQVKDGAAWAVLEYERWRRTHGGAALVVVPSGMVYTDNQHYRSAVVKRYGPPIDVSEFSDMYQSGSDGAEKEAVKSLTRVIEQRVVELTINAADWHILHAAVVARHILWTDDARIDPQSFVHVAQTLVDLLSDPPHDFPVNLRNLRKDLTDYYALLEHIKWIRTFLTVTFSALLRLPVFVVPLILHIPAYILANIGGKLAGDEVEARAQNKIIFGAMGRLAVHTLFVFTLALTKRLGWLESAITAIVFARIHDWLIDGNYTRWKRFLLTFHGLRATRNPIPESQLAEFLVPYTPPPNPYVSYANKPISPPPRPTSPVAHRLIVPLLKARRKAVLALATCFQELQRAARAGSVFVAASPHMARTYGGQHIQASIAESPDGVPLLASAQRDASEVIEFLKSRGAVFPTLNTTDRISSST